MTSQGQLVNDRTGVCTSAVDLETVFGFFQVKNERFIIYDQ